MPWITVDYERALYVDRGVNVILCDRLPSPGTLVLKVSVVAASAGRNKNSRSRRYAAARRRAKIDWAANRQAQKRRRKARKGRNK